MNTKDENTIGTFADLLLPVPIPNLFTYHVPDSLEQISAVGSRVVVQFGRKKILTGIIKTIHNNPPEKYESRPILEILDDQPVVNHLQLKLYEWMARYYMCTEGEVMNAALPTGLKLSSESKIQLNPDFDAEKSEELFSDKELMLINALKGEKSLTYPQAGIILKIRNIYHILKSLIRKEAILIYEEVKDKYSPKKEKRIRLNETFVDEINLETLFETLHKKPKQTDVLMKFLQKVPVLENPWMNLNGIRKDELVDATISVSSVNTLKKNGIFEEFEVIIPRFKEFESTEYDVQLSALQQETLSSITTHFRTHDTVLLHGITGSGKTEIYISLIQEVLESGRQVLYLMPEIALTTHIVGRLKKVFGNTFGVYHSKFSDNERVEVWKGVNSGNLQFVAGVRSSVFLPFHDLGLIIIDEEHEPSFKQYDPAPRYHARDVAMVMARDHEAKVLLGSATPSLESYFMAKKEKYGIVNLKERFGAAVMPEMIVADISREKKQNKLKGDFTSVLVENLEQNLKEGGQAIIFQNRRGYSPYILCEECGWIPKCTNCSVSLTYHMYHDELICHYCGYRTPVPAICEACGSTRMKTIGIGTEKIEDDLKILLPEAKVRRMDLDTTRSKYSYQNILNDFENGEIDILVGTQMVSKGLDFDKVRLVGVVDADRTIHFPDFRSGERAFQLLTQVSGRSGRRDVKGKVVIQTYDPSQRILNKIIHNDYDSMALEEILERKKFNYPPFCRMIRIHIKHVDRNLSARIARAMADLSVKNFGKGRVLGPEEPLIAKIRNEYIMTILIKMERDRVNLSLIKQKLLIIARDLLLEKEHRKGRIIFDVDPQ
ncbi:primosomal protein N' [Bacteroidota bacterium]